MAYKKSAIDLEIERRIAERDRLLLRAQRGASRSTPLSNEVISPRDLLALVQRVAQLELALTRYLDPEWLASATADELMLNARGALELAGHGEDPSTAALRTSA
jgi:hypothetical protein